jgi:prepilin-type N-terminal cleavage/methylation domain-containing protein
MSRARLPKTAGHAADAFPAGAVIHRLRGGAFTLLELLVVVAILGLLAGMLVPALARARSAAIRVYCQGHLRQWGTAFEMYAMTGGFYPHIDGRDRAGDSPGRSPADQADWWSGWVDVLPPLLGHRSWRDHAPWEKPGAGTFFQCCAAELAADREYGYYPRRNGFFSYAMNSCLELDENCRRAPGDGGVPMPSFLQTDWIVRPQEVVLLFDQLLKPALGYDGRLCDRSAGRYCGSYPKAFAARHALSSKVLGGSILFCDYHVEFADRVWKDSWPADLEVPPRDDPNWFPYPPGRH